LTGPVDQAHQFVTIPIISKDGVPGFGLHQHLETRTVVFRMAVIPMVAMMIVACFLCRKKALLSGPNLKAESFNAQNGWDFKTDSTKSFRIIIVPDKSPVFPIPAVSIAFFSLSIRGLKHSITPEY
jgi:hypothetical protein